MTAARQISAAERHYSGHITEPERWQDFEPRVGDVIVATPAKSGTTWTQSIIAMLLQGTTELSDKLSALSPWIDANFAPRAQTKAAIATQPGRRVIKTHTPADGWPVWEGVSVVTVFRHPLEVFQSIRKHLKNSKIVDEHPLLDDLDAALSHFLTTEHTDENIDSDSLAAIIRMFQINVLSGRHPDLLVLNYAAMLRDHAGTVSRLDAFLGTNASPALLAEVTEATAFTRMKQDAAQFAPEADMDIWKDVTGFFAGGRSGSGHAGLTDVQIAAYEARLVELLPDPVYRRWLETGEGHV